MKIEDLAYQIAKETLELLEKKFYYKIPDDHKREVQLVIREDLKNIMERAKK